MTKIDLLKRATEAPMVKGQARYKMDCDANVRKRQGSTIGDFVYNYKPPHPGYAISVSLARELGPKKFCPYNFVEVQLTTVTMEIDRIEKKCQFIACSLKDHVTKLRPKPHPEFRRNSLKTLGSSQTCTSSGES